MKKVYLLIGSIALFSACNKEIDPITPDNDAPVIRNVDITVDADRAISKATYDDENDLAAIWESEDKVMALKGMHSQSNDATDNGSQLNIASGQGEGRAEFTGTVKTSTKASDEAFWYFAYPADAAAMSAKVERSGIFSYTYAYTNQVSITIPGDQDGLKWTPYMFASTEKLNDDAPKSAKFQTLSACLAIKLAAASDGYIPTKVKSIKIESNQSNLYGTFSKTVNDNNTKISLGTSDFIGTGNTFYKEYADGTDKKEFRFNIPAGIETGNLTVTIVDDKGHTVTRYAGSKAVEASHKRNLKFTWEPESSFVNVTFNSVVANTTYSYFKDGNLTAANTLDSRLKAFCSADVTIEGVDNPEVSYKFSVDNTTTVETGSTPSYTFTDLDVKAHTLVVIVIVNGKEYRSAPVTFHITGIPYSATPPTKANGWTGNGEWNNSYVTLNSNDNISLTLYAPSDINISLYEELSITGKTLTLKYYLDCSGQRLASYERTYGSTTTHNQTFATTLKAANPVIKCTSDASVASTSYANLKKITINYR